MHFGVITAGFKWVRVCLCVCLCADCVSDCSLKQTGTFFSWPTLSANELFVRTNICFCMFWGEAWLACLIGANVLWVLSSFEDSLFYSVNPNRFCLVSNQKFIELTERHYNSFSGGETIRSSIQNCCKVCSVCGLSSLLTLTAPQMTLMVDEIDFLSCYIWLMFCGLSFYVFIANDYSFYAQ